VHLTKFAVQGFRSLTDVSNIPISGPTILAGQNDGGKTAILAALAFLLGKYKLTEEDRTYSQAASARQVEEPLLRCELTEVEGTFDLGDWEQQAFNLPARLRVRRIAGDDLQSRLEYWAPVPDDERLRDLSASSATDLKALCQELALIPQANRKAEYEAALRAFAAEHSTGEGWNAAPSALGKRLPLLLSFEGTSERPNDAVKAALKERFDMHVADETLRGHIAELEVRVQEQLQTDAKSLCEHIRSRCDDLFEVSVEPRVSFTEGFQGAPLKISKTSGEPVSLERSGAGSARRISLAIWEWTSNLLSEETDVIGQEAEDVAPPLQTIVLYDEPDTHLDYEHQRKIMKLIRDQSAIENVRVVVATHSMNLIDGVDISDVVHLKLQNGRTMVERLGTNEHDEVDLHLRKIAASLGLRNSVLLHERCFLAVEGETEQRALPLLFRLSEGLSLQSAGIALWGCFNNDGALHLARYLVQHGRTVMLMVDADSRERPKSIFTQSRLTEFFGSQVDDVVTMIGEPDGFRELEEVFDDNLWATAANDIWPRDLPWTTEDFTQHRSARKFSEAVLEMVKTGSEQGPTGKPQMMYELAAALTEPEQVPSQLRKAFSDLRILAG